MRQSTQRSVRIVANWGCSAGSDCLCKFGLIQIENERLLNRRWKDWSRRDFVGHVAPAADHPFDAFIMAMDLNSLILTSTLRAVVRLPRRWERRGDGHWAVNSDCEARSLDEARCIARCWREGKLYADCVRLGKQVGQLSINDLPRRDCFSSVNRGIVIVRREGVVRGMVHTQFQNLWTHFKFLEVQYFSEIFRRREERSDSEVRVK